MKQKLIRITTVPISLDKLLSGQLNYMNQFYEVIGVSSDKPYLEQISKKENTAIFHLEMTRKITPFKDFLAILKLYRYLKKEQPQIVHSHTPKAGLVAMIASNLAGVPIRLHTVAGLPLMEAKGVKRKVLNVVEKLIYACATKVYPNSYGLYDFILKEKFCHPKKLKVIGNGSSNGIDTSFFNPDIFNIEEKKALRERLNIFSDDFVFVFVGRLVSDKGINELIEAFTKLNAIFSKAKLLLVGPLESELDPLKEKILKEIEKNTSIISVGYQNDVRPFFAMSNALVFPSYREGFPNVVMQAGAMELPSIVSDINGCNEIIIPNHNGVIIPVKNTIAIFEAMKSLLENTSFYNELLQNARERIVSNYEQKKVWSAILEEYKSIESNV
ncbi:glycosyltransferase family 4 protein [Flavobacterium jejuense]|uniref:Glycosyltransferase family 4 protein n=1 Tax=Flavobacterium jejuense TaxID=1544455 RepID=A0ABX0IR20_9FLAO|nr:glycosyltransferase family 4 protein [Flavobacterium jejuense]NHN26153.1 glycosyltransferase family 4 protein [Flavobacterium jejuense]